MNTTEKAYIGILVGGALVLFLVSYFSLTGQKFSLLPGGNENTNNPMNGENSSPRLARGAACQQDTDCVYALNAYPIKRCISGNCPPEDEPNQPAQGDSKYEWLDAYQESCVNAAALKNQSLNGEPLQIDTRAATCTCEPVQSTGESITSLFGQAKCTTKKNQDG